MKGSLPAPANSEALPSSIGPKKKFKTKRKEKKQTWKINMPPPLFKGPLTTSTSVRAL